DLGDFVACEHLTQLELAVVLREDTRPSGDNAFAALLQRKGEAHERAYLESLRESGHAVIEVGLGETRDWEAAARATEEAMRAGVSAYYRRVRRRFESAAANRPHTAPYPCEHCEVCIFQDACEDRWEREDHLLRVASIRRDQIGKLAAGGITSLTALAGARPG